MDPLPTRSEFAARLREHAALFRRASIKILVTCGATCVLGMTLTIATADHGQMRWLGFVGFGIAMISIIGGMLYLDQQRSAISCAVNVKCPHCSAPLLQLNAKLALATGRCAECGELVVHETESPQSGV